MRHTERPQSGGVSPAAPDVTYEDVRQSFRVRLHGEHARLTVLTEALGSAALAPARVFADLEAYAHRLRGAAAVFDFPELRDAARALEVAANASVTERAPANDSRVEAAIRTLGERLACLTANTPSSGLAMAPASAN